MAEAGIEIDGERYEVPSLDSLDMDECQILYDLAGIVQEDFVPLHPDSAEEEKILHESAILMRIRNPAFKRALVHIAYHRVHPELGRHEIEGLIGKLSGLDVTIAMLRGDEEEDPQKSSPNEPENTSDTSETSNSPDSGKPSGSGSGARVVLLGPIGTGKSGMSSQESDLLTSAS